MGFLKKILIYAVFIYFALLAFLIFFQRSLIYFPTETPPRFDHYGFAAQDYASVRTTTSDDFAISGWLHRGEPDKPLIIWFHGNGGDYASRIYPAKFYVEKGYNVLLAGYRGYAGNDGRPTEIGLYKDGEAWIKFAAERLNKTGNDIILYGESLGTGVAVEMATRYNVRALILHTPYKSLYHVAQRQYPIYPVKLLMKDHFDNYSKISSIKIPVFMFHGTNDEIIPLSHVRQLYERANAPKELEVIDGAGHTDPYHYGIEKKVLSFLDQFDRKK